MGAVSSEIISTMLSNTAISKLLIKKKEKRDTLIKGHLSTATLK